MKNKTPGTVVPPEDTTFERHYTLYELADLWNISRNKLMQLFKDEPGVVKIPSRNGKRPGVREHYSWRIPESVAKRVRARMVS